MKDTPPLLGVILAGGKSRRMDGFDKYHIPLCGKTLFAHIADRLSPQVTDLIVNANDPSDFDGFKVVPDQESGLGPIGGIYSALQFASQNGFKKIVTVPCDTPYIPDNLVDKLLKIGKSRCIVASSQSGLHPVLAIWDVSALNDVKTSIERGERKLRRIIKAVDYTECIWSEGDDPFFNINTPDDLRIAESRLTQ
jgi:molybdopterin-guanine dinucleotide biosynthesis protein A